MGSRFLRFGEFTLDVGRETLSRNGEEARLRPKSFAVLLHLVEHAGQLVTKDEILDAVWRDKVVTEGSLTQCIVEIRRALADHEQRIVRTVARRGFILELPVLQVTDGTAPSAGVVAGSPEPALRASVPATPARFAPLHVILAVATIAAVAAWWQWTRPSPVAAMRPERTTTPAAAPNSIAVLRFADLSPAGDQAYFADGLAEEILHMLSQAPELRVTARTSSFAVDSDQADLRQIAAQLGVAHVLEGSVRRAGDKLRITAQLIDGSTGAHQWSRSYDVGDETILDIQRQVATDVAAALQVSLLAPMVPDSPQAVKAQEQFLLGRYLFHRRADGDLTLAASYFQQAVALDPGHARAWALLAGTYAAQGPYYRLAEQREALERALALDPGLAEAQLRLARVQRATGEHRAAELSFRRALELAPNDPLVLAGQGNRAMGAGRLDEALEFQRRALDVNPLSALYRGNFGLGLLGAGRLEEGIAELRRAHELTGGREFAVPIAEALLLLGRTEEARRELAAEPPGAELDKLLVLLGEGPRTAAARSRLEADDSFEGLVRRAEISAYEGHPDEAFDHLAAAAALAEHGSAPDLLVNHICCSALIGTLRDEAFWPGLVQRFTRASAGDYP